MPVRRSTSYDVRPKLASGARTFVPLYGLARTIALLPVATGRRRAGVVGDVVLQLRSPLQPGAGGADQATLLPMFEKTVLCRPADITQLGTLEIGALAESLLFYERTALILDPGSAPDLLRDIGTTTISRLLRTVFVDLFYLPDRTTIPNAGALPAPGYGVSNASVPGWQIDVHIPKVFAEIVGRRATQSG